MCALTSRYRVKHPIGTGAFGTVIRGEDIASSCEVAIKFQGDPSASSSIANECAIYSRVSGAPGFPTVYESGCDNGRNYFVMDLLGDSIGQRFRASNGRFSLKTVLMLIDQMLTRVEYLHAKGFVHRDLKPSNFLIGLNSRSNQVYLIDFGLATQWATAETGGNRIFAGTPVYASVHAQFRRDPSRRDDLESLA
jgi:serine/threonine protein kinase